jgi:hypothetical protein
MWETGNEEFVVIVLKGYKGVKAEMEKRALS